MPKMKTHSGAKKRFKVTGTGKLLGRRAFSTHILEKKSPKRKRRQARPSVISDHDRGRVRELLGAGGRAKPGRSDAAGGRARSEDAGPEGRRRNP
jgi:large subunit ribosomal protein L35